MEVRGYRWEVKLIVIEFGELNGNGGSVDVDVEMSRRKAALVYDYQSKLESPEQLLTIMMRMRS